MREASGMRARARSLAMLITIDMTIPEALNILWKHSKIHRNLNEEETLEQPKYLKPLAHYY